MSMFGSGPRSNILQTVAPMYQGIVNAEKQKGEAMRTAMGAFGQAIDPKTIGMNKFKKEFANADWSKAETFMRAGRQLMQTDPNAALGFIQKGQEMTAAMAPKASEFVTATRFVGGKEMHGSMNKVTGEFKSFGGEGKPAAAGAAPKTVKINTVDDEGNPVTRIVTEEEALEMGTFAAHVTEEEPKRTSSQRWEIKGVGERDTFVEGGIRYYAEGETKKPLPEGSRAIPKKQVIETPMTVTEEKGLLEDKLTSWPLYGAMEEGMQQARVALNTLNTLVEEGNSKSIPLLERAVSGLYNWVGGTKAQDEIKRMISAGSYPERIKQWAAKGFAGTLPAATMEEYRDIATMMYNVAKDAVESKIGQINKRYRSDMKLVDANEFLQTFIPPEAPQRSQKPQPISTQTIITTKQGVKYKYIGGPDGDRKDANNYKRIEDDDK